MPVRTPLPDKREEAKFWDTNASRLLAQPVIHRSFFDASLGYAWRIHKMTNAQYKIERDKIMRAGRVNG